VGLAELPGRRRGIAGVVGEEGEVEMGAADLERRLDGAEALERVAQRRRRPLPSPAPG